MNYICGDYLGSITHTTTSSGSVVQELSYDAWGRLRNPTNQTAYTPGSEPTLFLGRGYTGHEHLPWFGLVNMNARLYDPAVGRFLSPDPNIQAPDMTQNYNRYSYVLNNPLRYTDPTGEDYHSTNDPEEIKRLIEWLNSRDRTVTGPLNWIAFDFGSGWNHMSDADLLGKYRDFSGRYVFNDATNKFLYSYVSRGKGEWVVNGMFLNVNDLAAWDFIYDLASGCFSNDLSSYIKDGNYYRWTGFIYQMVKSQALQNVYPEFELLALGKAALSSLAKLVTKNVAKTGTNAVYQGLDAVMFGRR